MGMNGNIRGPGQMHPKGMIGWSYLGEAFSHLYFTKKCQKRLVCSYALEFSMNWLYCNMQNVSFETLLLA